MTVPGKPRKKKVLHPSIPIIEEREELFAKINHLNKNIVEINHALFQTPKQELAEIF